MDTSRSSTTAVEQGLSSSLFDSPQFTLSPQLSQSGSSSAALGQMADGAKKFSVREHAAALVQPPKAGPPPSVWRSIRAILLSSYLNVLLVCIPISWALGYAMPDRHTLVFVFSFLAIIPLAYLLAFATEELSMHVGQTLAGLMNATLGNAVELIISVVALTKCQLEIIQSSLVGSILSNLLLVLGMCFFAGGLMFSEQGFGLVASQADSSMLALSVIALLIPSAFVLALSKSSRFDPASLDKRILKMSHGVAIILLFIYSSYLFFQLITHRNLYEDDSKDVLESKKYGENPFMSKKFRRGKRSTRSQYTDTPSIASPPPLILFLGADDEMSHATLPTSNPESGGAVVPTQHGEIEDPQIGVPESVGLLVIVTVVTAITAEFLVDAIGEMTDDGGISKEFIGVILLPIVGNAADHATAVTVSVKDKLTLSLGVCVGSSIQIASFLIPFIVTLGWILDKPLTLLFDPLQSTVLFLSALTVNYAIRDGKSNWFEGMILICLYFILCVTFWYYPGADPVLTC